jgi:hypothetical protein
MIVACPSCSSRFQYPEDRFQGVASKRFKCPKCELVFEVLNPAFPKLPGSGPADPLPPTVPATPGAVAPARRAAPRMAPLEPEGSGLPGSGLPEPGLPAPAPPVPEPATARPAMTTARKKRDAMLAAAGLGPGDMPPDIRFSLAFLTGPLASTVRVIDSALTTIGREEGDVIINDPEASRRHAQVEIHPDGSAWITDLGSTNGTSTLGKTIEGPTQLFDRQEFTCGRSTFMLLIRPIDTMSPD